MKTEDRHQIGHLRYLAASQIEYPSGSLSGLTMWTGEDQAIGPITGGLVDPSTRRLRYFVVERPSALRRRRYLVSAETTPVLDSANCKLCVDAGDDDLERFDARSVHPFSDEDLITAMFARPAA